MIDLPEDAKVDVLFTHLTQVEVIGKGDIAALLQHIDQEAIPTEYGGSCNCPGGCCPIFTKEEVELAYAKMIRFLWCFICDLSKK